VRWIDMAKNYDIKTVSKPLSGVSSHIVIGSSVAAGMTRYVTFLRVQQVAAKMNEGTRVIFCSTTASDTAANTAAASTAQKLVAHFPSALAGAAGGATELKRLQTPSVPDTEHPLFTIASSKWFTAYLMSDAGWSYPVYVFAQYYDE